MKKIISLFLTICLITSICAFMPISVSAATSGTCGDNLTWTLDDEGTLTISGTGAMWDWERGTPPWNEYRSQITSVVIEPGVTYIGNQAFRNTTYIPITDGLKNDKLTSITIPNTVVSIGRYAFVNCYSLESISFPDSISSTSEILLFNCISLKSVKTSKNAACYFNNCISLENVEIPYGSTQCSIFNECTNLKNIKIPSTIKGIPANAFQDCSALETVELPDSIKSIGNYAFDDCKNLKNISIPNNVNYIGELAFNNCSSLENVEFPKSLIEIGRSAFYNTALKKVTIPEGVETVNMYAFGNCANLTEINLPSTFKNSEVTMPGGNKSGFGKFCQECPNLASINVSSQNTLYSSYDGILYNKDKSKLLVCPDGKKSISIPDSVTEIGSCAFYKCANLEKIIIPKNITTLDGFALTYCTNAKDIIILSDITDISAGCFFGCSSLNNLFIPKTVDTIEMAFAYCDALTDIYYQGQENEWENISIADAATTYIENATIHYNSRIATYDYATNGGDSSTVEYNIVTSGENADLSPTATKTGYNFVGWNTDPNAKSALSSYTVTDDVTLYAIYAMPVTGVTLNKSAVNLEKGKTETLTATVAPSNATNKNVSWKSSNTGVATVANGVVTAVSAGTATITATTADGGYAVSCTVTVTEKVIDENAPKITITGIKTMPGKEFQVTVDLANNTGFVDLGIEVGYNSEVMTLTGITANSGVGATFTPAQSYTANPYNFGWSGTSNIAYNGNLATLTFTVAEDIPDGIYPITVDYYKGRNGDYTDGEDVNYDENGDAVGFVYISGNIIVASYIPGDINGDEKVNNKDATQLLRYLAGWSLSDITSDALDVDGSGSVNNKDATHILRYLAGWNITLH